MQTHCIWVKPLQCVLPDPCSVSCHTLESGQTQLALMVLSTSRPDVQIGRVHCSSHVSWEGGTICIQPIRWVYLNQQAIFCQLSRPSCVSTEHVRLFTKSTEKR